MTPVLRRTRETAPRKGPAVTPRRTILIADDEPAIRQLVRVSLTGTAYHLLEAADGDAAWEFLQAERPAVAILDIRMPGRDGLALTRAIRADPALARTPVIILTGLLGADMEAQSRAAGADYHLTKPFWTRDLLATIEACLQATV